MAPSTVKGRNLGTPTGGAFAAVSTGENYVCGAQTTAAIACCGCDTWGQATPPEGADTVELTAGRNMR